MAQTGQVVSGKYRVEKVLGEGGMGVVLAAKHIDLEERVALKFLRRDLAADRDLVARFTQEARDAVKLKNEYVARTYDVGFEDGVPYIVMEYLEGHDLAQELAVSGTLGIDIAAEYMIQSCAGVAAAHARGLVHCDIKPENLFLARRDDGSTGVKVLDFGISKAMIASGALEKGAGLVGSPAYMSPEQLVGGEVDYRSDIWSLGAVLFEALTGVPPFEADLPILQMVDNVRSTPHRRLSDYRPTAPAELDVIVDRCLEKDPAKRIQSAAELAIMLLAFAPRRARVAAERASSVTRAAGLLSDRAIALPSSSRPPSSNVHIAVSRVASPPIAVASSPLPPVSASISAPPRRWMLPLIGVVVALAALGFLALRRGGPPSPAASAPTPLAAPSIAPATSAGRIAPAAPGAREPLSAAPLADVQPAPATNVAVDANAPAPARPSSDAAAAAGARTPHAPVPRSPPNTPPPVAPRPDLDIRMTR